MALLAPLSVLSPVFFFASSGVNYRLRDLILTAFLIAVAVAMCGLSYLFFAVELNPSNYLLLLFYLVVAMLISRWEFEKRSVIKVLRMVIVCSFCLAVLYTFLPELYVLIRESFSFYTRDGGSVHELRYSFIFSDPNNFSVVMVSCWLFYLEFRGEAKFFEVFMVTFLVLYSIVCSASVTGVLMFGVAAMVRFLFFSVGFRSLTILCGAAIVLGFLMMAGDVGEHVFDRIRSASIASRIDIWKDFNFDYFYSNALFGPGEVFVDGEVRRPHNIILRMWSFGGITFGLVVVFLANLFQPVRAKGLVFLIPIAAVLFLNDGFFDVRFIFFCLFFLLLVKKISVEEVA